MWTHDYRRVIRRAILILFAQALAWVVAIAAVVLVAVLLLGCVSTPLPAPADLGGPDLACGRLAPSCTFIDGGVTPCSDQVMPVNCYRGNVEQLRCVPDPATVPKGYSYFVVADCALCASTCAP